MEKEFPDKAALKTERQYKEVRERAGLILEFYLRGKANASLEAKIQDWVTSEGFEEAKDEALWEMWDRYVTCAEIPDSYACTSLEKMRGRLGFSTPEPAENEEGKREKRRRPLGRRWLRIAAAAVLLLGVAGGLFFLEMEKIGEPDLFGARLNKTARTVEMIWQRVTTGEEDNRQHVVLPDGSEVWLSRNTTIVYPPDFSDVRTVSLEGEAYFSVVKQDGNPFTVKGEGFNIKVLGTEFLVRSQFNEALAEVTLKRGAVEVELAGTTHLLQQANEQLIFDRFINEILIRQILPESIMESIEEEIVSEVKASLPANSRASGQSDLNFEGRSLSEVIRTLSSHYNVVFAVDDRIPQEMVVVVRFDGTESLNEVLFIIANTVGVFDYTIDGQNVTLIKR